jgi:hypothetical protein
MSTVRCTITRWVDAAFPGWVEVSFTQVDGNTVTVVEKVPVLGVDVDAETAFPVVVDIDRELLDNTLSK